MGAPARIADAESVCACVCRILTRSQGNNDVKPEDIIEAPAMHGVRSFGGRMQGAGSSANENHGIRVLCSSLLGWGEGEEAPSVPEGFERVET